MLDSIWGTRFRKLVSLAITLGFIAVVVTHWSFFTGTVKMIKGLTSDDPSVPSDAPQWRK